MENNKKMPMLPLRGFVVFPKSVINFDVGRKKSLQALESAMINDSQLILAVQKDAIDEEPKENDIYDIGIIVKIKQMLKLPEGIVRVVVDSQARVKIKNYVKEEPYFEVEYEVLDKPVYDEIYTKALIKLAEDALHRFVQIKGKVAPETVMKLLETDDIGNLADEIATNLPINFKDRVKVLLETSEEKRLKLVISLLENQAEVEEMKANLKKEVSSKVNKNQKEYYLREQLKIIQEALGESNSVESEIASFKEKLKAINPPKEVEEKINKEIGRLENLSNSSSEGNVIRNYIDTVLDLPWQEKDKSEIGLKEVEKNLNEKHYGLTKVKERIVEHIAVRSLVEKSKSPIICLVGPPGVGKTSIASSIAEAIGYHYVRVSLGGVRDESEIRGHRKTYVGAMPGRIINGLIKAGVNNPVMVLDEIDKMSNDLRGDPASALLEVLDPEQNQFFRDHYVELDFDLSDVFFIATANSLQGIPGPLRDRMEIIQLSSYTAIEKFHIAKEYLVDKQLKNNGLKKGQVKMGDEVLQCIIDEYTREAGVRNLERKIGDICRKSAKNILVENKKYVKITKSNLNKYLGTPIFSYDKIQGKKEIGIVRGLAWTQVGGDTLSVEVNLMKGSGKFQLTGKLGDVMQESAKTAFSFIRSQSDSLNLAEDFYKKYDIHIHIPEGAIPKDGPSAGITMATAMISALTNKPVPCDIGMTGEITLRGKVLPIGGIKEKLIAAKRYGLTKVLVPKENEKHVIELEKEIKKDLNIVFVEQMDEVLKNCFDEV